MFEILKRFIGKKEKIKDPLDEARKDAPLAKQAVTSSRKSKNAAKSEKAADPLKKEGKKTDKSLPSPSPRPPKKRKKQKQRFNKHGLPVFQKDSDISALFREEEKSSSHTPPAARKKMEKGAERSKRSAKKQPPKNRHGIPIFSEQTDFSVFFSDDSDVLSSSQQQEKNFPKKGRATAEEDFGTLLEQSISGKTAETLLQEKIDAMPPDRPPTREEKLRCYPPPQDELDLHRHTAQEAIEKTEQFIRTARHRGKRTLLIIVGKGTHSRHKAVLPDVVETKIIELKRKNLVLTFEWEKGRKTKSGALIVYLNPF